MAAVDSNDRAESRLARRVRKSVGWAASGLFVLLVALGGAMALVPIWRDALPNGYRVFRPGGPRVIVDGDHRLVVEGVVTIRTKETLVLCGVCDPAGPLTSNDVTVGFVALETRSGEMWRSDTPEGLIGTLEREGYRAIEPVVAALQRR